MANCTRYVVFLFSLCFMFAGEARALTIDSVSIVEPASDNPVLRYGKLELLVTLSGSIAMNNYEPSPAFGGLDLAATFVAPDAAQTNIKGYYDGSAWRIRFAPGVIGNWTFSVGAADSGGSATWTGGTFVCSTSIYPGFAAVSGRYLKFSNGSTCFAVGHNNGWQYDVEQPAFTDMAAQGENLLSFWMASPWIVPADNIPRAPIENAADGIGNYNQASCAYLDGVVARAELAGVYLLPSIWAHDQLCDGTPQFWPASWNNNAYKTLCAAKDFYTTTAGGVDTPQWRYQQNFYRYVLARWGYSRAIAGFVAVCEIDGTAGFVLNPGQINPWSAKVQNYFLANDKFRVSASKYPLSLSRVDQPAYDTGLHMRSTDSYASKTNNIAVAQTIASQTTTMRSSGKPVFHAEFGGDVLAGASQPTHLHNGLWAGVSAGASMTPLLWCDGGSFPMLTNTSTGPAMRAQLQFLSQFTSGISYIADPAVTAANPTYNSNSVRGWGMRITNRAFVWTQKTQTGNIGGQNLTVSNLASGQYTVAWYDAWSNGAAPFTTSSVSVGGQGKLTVKIPNLARSDIVCSIYPRN